MSRKFWRSPSKFSSHQIWCFGLFFKGFRPNLSQAGTESTVVNLIFLVGRSSYELYLTFPLVCLAVPGVPLWFWNRIKGKPAKSAGTVKFFCLVSGQHPNKTINPLQFVTTWQTSLSYIHHHSQKTEWLVEVKSRFVQMHLEVFSEGV